MRRPSVLLGTIGVAVGTLSLLAFAGVRPPLSFPDLRLSLPSGSVKIFGSEGSAGSGRAPLSGSLAIALPGATNGMNHSSPATPYILGVSTDPRGTEVGTLTTVGPPSGVISSAGTLISTVDGAAFEVSGVKITKVLGPTVDAVAQVAGPVEKAVRPATERAEELLAEFIPADSP